MLEGGNQAADLARLGQKVVVVSLSVNGVTVAWMAQNRKDLYKTVLLAPFFAPFNLPDLTLIPLERLLLRLPNMFFCGIPGKGYLAGPPYAYPRFPTRVIGETMFLGRVVLDESRVLPPQCPSILTVTSASDIAANNIVTEQLVANWRALRPAGIETFEFLPTNKSLTTLSIRTKPTSESTWSTQRLSSFSRIRFYLQLSCIIRKNTISINVIAA